MTYKKARVAELVDAADSKSAIRKDVLVRFQSRALDYEGFRQRSSLRCFEICKQFANNWKKGVEYI